MALATKTVRYGWGSLTTATADLTKTSLGTKTVYIPETTSRVIRSAFVVFAGQDIITATGGSVNRVQVSVGIDAVADSDVNDLAATIANTGENIALHWHADFTAYFVTNFTGTSHSVETFWLQSQNTGTTGGYRNVSAELFITYEYDDADATHIKSVVLPLESLVGALATTMTQIGTNQIPILTGGSGILPESSPVIRDYYFVVEGNEANGGTATDWTLGLEIDTDGEFAFGAQECALASDRMCRWIYDRSATVPTTTATHQFKARSNALARLNHMSIQLVVTYEFTPPAAGANRTINSIMVPFQVEAGQLGGSIAGDNSRARVRVRIDEPGTITLRQSGVQVFIQAAAAIAGLNARCGAQAYRAYTHNVATACGTACFQFRIDSGAAGGAGVTLARGENSIDIDIYRTDTADLAPGTSGVLILNYESDTATGGVSRHNRATWWHFDRPKTTAAALVSTIAAVAPVLAETNFSITAPVGWLSYLNDATALNLLSLLVEELSGDHADDGWHEYSSAVISDAELGVIVKFFADQGDFFQRWWADTDARRAVVETARRYRLAPLASARFTSLIMVVTYSSQYFAISGTVTDSAGGTVNLAAYRVSDGLLLGTTSRTGNGSYTINVPVDDSCFVEARESATYLGRSDNDTPTRVA